MLDFWLTHKVDAHDFLLWQTPILPYYEQLLINHVVGHDSYVNPCASLKERWSERGLLNISRLVLSPASGVASGRTRDRENARRILSRHIYAGGHAFELSDCRGRHQ